MFKKGNFVKDKKYGLIGMIDEVFLNWEDLKSKNDFITLDPNNQSNEMDHIEKIINGDPKDTWLNQQEIPFNEEQLKEKWYSLRILDGGSIWTCHSLIEMVDNALN